MNNHIIWHVHLERRDELQKVARDMRIVRKGKIKRIQRKERVFVNVGDFLISVGLRVKARYDPAMS